MPQRSVSHESSSASVSSPSASSTTTASSHAGEEQEDEQGERIKIVEAAIDMIQEYEDFIGNRSGGGNKDQVLDVATTAAVDAK